MKKTAFLFPGQGSQAVGMAADLYEAHEDVRKIFETAEKITNIPVKSLCFEGPMGDLTQTVNLQPCVTTVNLAFLSVLQKAGIQPQFSAGHSLGEFSALCSAGILSVEDTLQLVNTRGALMDREANKNKGAMYALIGLEIGAVESIVADASADGIVSAANHNMKTQIVITGEPAAVKKAASMAKEQGAKAVPLKVSGAWHSELIRGAEAEFQTAADKADFKAPQHPVVHNVTADVASVPEEIRALMVRQLCSPVRWYDSILKLMAEKVEVFVEVGPGKVLTGLVKKILPGDYPAALYNINDMKSLENYIQTAK